MSKAIINQNPSNLHPKKKQQERKVRLNGWYLCLGPGGNGGGCGGDG